MPNNKKGFSIIKGFSILTKISFGMITPILVGVIFGKFLDNRFSKNNLFLIIFTIIGGILAFQYLIIQSAKISKNDRR
ncbi:MAG TPA: AtpZ/AtpI family protein [Eubacteriaceae bacterium]|jgi:F0F1-type ATP synthase assembly protein I|nr:AtpZ/AtpI family protein [Eubacteriaceae bacterium]